MHFALRSHTLLLGLARALLANALTLDVIDSASIKTAAQSVARGLLTYYNGTKPGQSIGLFEEPSVPWVVSGAVWAGLIDYWKYTADTQYNGLVQEALLAQSGPNENYMVPNQTQQEGNSHQAIWALAAMIAAEQQLPSPSTTPSWIDLAKNVFNLQASRWDTSTYGGGVRWQISTSNTSSDQKGSASAGTFFQLAARLARYTGNQTYADWATKTWDWTTSIGFIDSKFAVYNGAHTQTNCSDLYKTELTYLAGTFLYGCAAMFNSTNDAAQWQYRTESILSAMSIFFNSTASLIPDVMTEVACELSSTCEGGDFAAKGITAQWMGATTQIAPFTKNTITTYLQASAKGAANQCAEKNGAVTTCGAHWNESSFDGSTGVGQQLSTLNVIVANLATNAPAPATANSTTDPSTSSTNSSSTSVTGHPSITTKSTSSRLLYVGTAGLTASLLVFAAFLL